MVQIRIQAPSSAVMSRMRNGHPVRMKPHIDGEGLTIDVAPETYDAMTRSFRKGKATQIALRPDEIQGSGLKGSGWYDSAKATAKAIANSKTAKDFAKKKADEAIEYATRMAEESGYVPKELTEAGKKYAKQYASNTIEKGVGLTGRKPVGMGRLLDLEEARRHAKPVGGSADRDQYVARMKDAIAKISAKRTAEKKALIAKREANKASRSAPIEGEGWYDSAKATAKAIANSKTAKDYAKKKADEAIEYATRMAEESGYVPKELTQAGNKYAKQYASKTIEAGVGLGGRLNSNAWMTGGGALSPEKLEALNQLTGQRMGFLSHANRGLALAGLEGDRIAHGLATARGQHGTGLYAQSGAHPMGRSSRTASHGLHEMGSVGKGGNLMGAGLPPALTSQPASQNFQWGSRLPVAYQHISQTGKGLYG